MIADAGYIPYRQVDGLTLPEATTKTLYTATATSRIAKPETSADYYYHCKDTNIYCGASYNIVFDLGLFSGGQFFRIRNYKDNSEKWCRFHCDFSYESSDVKIPTEQCELGKCFITTKGLMWCIKRYTDDEIVLQGCGDNDYIYRRTDRRTEQFATIQD